ncbi:BrnT family toxin [Bosea sp. 685]|uniref:BrnT family toxin n=1 Tax=Bosea sp. 685 TaxID=3080057 RepID=UPI00289320C6|nr:BrnT family toxin [Bosea sp. 685]WNJ94033.1 BrnT family toxin [Bosea sp. 685]
MPEFEWDPEKDTTNVAKHGVAFEFAKRIFEGPVLSWIDDRIDYGEVREISIGVIDGFVMLVVVHTDRDGRIRIISARSASQKERQRYETSL